MILWPDSKSCICNSSYVGVSVKGIRCPCSSCPCSTDSIGVCRRNSLKIESRHIEVVCIFWNLGNWMVLGDLRFGWEGFLALSCYVDYESRVIFLLMS